MSSMHDPIETSLQVKVFDFALSELIQQNRESFDPLWSIDSWVKFLIWLALNCGLSGERESLELFADALGQQTVRMRRIFFERVLLDQKLKIMADPAESQILVMHLDGQDPLNSKNVLKALHQVGLTDRADSDPLHWQMLDAAIAIPWKPLDLVDECQ